MTQLNPRTVILKLMLANEQDQLTAREAVGACWLLGIRENSTRVALARLAGAEMIEAAGRGAYRLGPKATGLATEVTSWRTAEERVTEWDGSWVAVHTGALNRADRVALRGRERALELLGLRELERGLHVRPNNLRGGVLDARERLRKVASDFDAPVFVVRDFDSDTDQRARQLWNSEAMTRAYQDTRRKVEEWLAQADKLDPFVAGRESYLLGDKAITHLVFDPLLPAPLVDVDERRAFRDAVLRIDRVGHAIWRELARLYSSMQTLPASNATAHPQ